jgi:cytochrome c oxidase cbb3-type subunit 1
MLVGVIIAAQLAWPELNFGIPWLSYGRLRPLHTNAVIFAFGGCALFASAYYVVQRTCHVQLFAGKLASFTFWGWQLVIVLAAITLPLGYHHRQGVRRARMADRPADRRGVGRLRDRVLRHDRARARCSTSTWPNWFFGAFIIDRRAAAHRQQRWRCRSSLIKSYSAYAGRAGRDDAVVVRPQRGGLLPHRRLPRHDVLLHAQAGRSARSTRYRLSIVHFWALIFTYMWAGPHHLHYTALPDWAQSLGMVFSLMLLAPSLGRHDQRHHDPLGCLAQAARRPDPEVPRSCRCRSTACRPSKAR